MKIKPERETFTSTSSYIDSIAMFALQILGRAAAGVTSDRKSTEFQTICLIYKSIFKLITRSQSDIASFAVICFLAFGIGFRSIFTTLTAVACFPRI